MNLYSDGPSQRAEQRRRRRSPLNIGVMIDEPARAATVLRLIDFTGLGCRVAGTLQGIADSRVWITLPELPSMPARICWHAQRSTGIEFECPLHPVVANRLLRVHDSEDALVLEQFNAACAALDQSGKADSASAGSRRPVKQPKGSGMAGKITQVWSRRTDHRREPRFAEVRTEAALRICGTHASVLDVSTSGIRVCGGVAGRVGENLAVEFDGYPPIKGLLVWQRGELAGISLPPHALDLYDDPA